MMTATQWLGVVLFLLFGVGIAFAFRQGMKVKPDKNRKTEDWPRITLGGSS
jgi:cbb3-type cytochrome oxidase subunit 3